jgi:hypothetical protein
MSGILPRNHKFRSSEEIRELICSISKSFHGLFSWNNQTFVFDVVLSKDLGEFPAGTILHWMCIRDFSLEALIMDKGGNLYKFHLTTITILTVDDTHEPEYIESEMFNSKENF